MNIFKTKKEEFLIPIHGTIRSLEQVPDAVFSQKLLGDGFAIEPAGDLAQIVSPVSGMLTVCFPTKHAYGLQTKDGIEVLLHLGIDTVDLNGEGFTCHVKQGQKIRQGDLLCTMDVSVIRSKNKPTICPIIITSGQHVSLHQSDVVVAVKQPGVVSIL